MLNSIKKYNLVLLISCFVTFIFSCNVLKKQSSQNSFQNKNTIKQINNLLDSFHVLAAESNFEKYFNLFEENAVFIGTDATERWTKKEFEIYAKPFFDKKKTWNFKPIQRTVNIQSKEIAWFDELLSTQMKVCRGSGILVKENNEWKVKQYVLSMTIPNEHTKAVVEIKKTIEDSLILKLMKQ